MAENAASTGNDALKEKIRKVLALLEGAKTEGEAHAASLALQRLLAKTDLSMEDVIARSRKGCRKRYTLGNDPRELPTTSSPTTTGSRFPTRASSKPLHSHRKCPASHIEVQGLLFFPVDTRHMLAAPMSSWSHSGAALPLPTPYSH